MDFKDQRFVALMILAGIGMVFNSCNSSISWEEAQEANTYEAYQAYIEANPEGEYLEKAQKLAEGRYWTTIKDDTAASVFQKYLELFPDGAHKTKAKLMAGEGTMATKAKVTGSSVIIRANHTTDAPSVGVVAREGTIVQILDWYNAGSSNEALLKQAITVSHEGQQFQLSQGKAVQVLADLKDSLQVSFATPNNASVEVIISKSAVKSMSGQMWYKISTRDGITGWMYGEFIEEL